MNLQEIKQAVESGKLVFWKNEAYQVTKDSLGQWFIKCHLNNHHIGLTRGDGETMNGKPEDFFTK